MPFFFIVPVWLFLLFSGIVLLFVPRLRLVGFYVIIVSTTATLTSNIKWLGVALIGAYILGWEL